jgi:mycofactocin biosynthetic radical S-adenosylmethionine protein MftC
MRYSHSVDRLPADRPPLVLVPQFFGSTVFDRRNSRYLPFDEEATRLLTRLRDTAFEEVHAQWRSGESEERVAALERFFDTFSDLGFFTLDRRLAGGVLPVDPPEDHLVGPLAVHLEVISSCNLTCTHCFAGDLPRHEHRLSLAELDSLFGQMAAMGSFRLGLTGGEPLLRRDLFDIIDLSTNHGLCPCITTNGLLIDEEVACGLGERDPVWVNVSLEGPTAATNDAVRGEGTFQRVLDRLRVLREHSRFTLAFTLMSTNVGEVEQCVELAERVGASTAVFRPLYPVGVARRHPDLMPTFDQYCEALEALERLARTSADGGFDVRHLDPFSPAARREVQAVTYTNLGCGAGNLVCSVSVSGDTNPCSFLGADHVAGNLRNQSLSALWHDSAGFRGIRALPGGNPCGGCDTGTRDGGSDHFTGGCRARALVLNGSINAADPWLDAATAPGAAHRRSLPLLTLELDRGAR